MKRLIRLCGCGRLHLWCDGQVFKTNEGWDGYATVVLDDGSADGLLLQYKSLGNRTINECEYMAVIDALEWSIGRKLRAHVTTDSGLILGHLNKDWRCEVHLRSYRDWVARLVQQTGAMVDWAGRDYNLAGWINAAVLLERAKAKRLRDKEVVNHG